LALAFILGPASPAQAADVGQELQEAAAETGSAAGQVLSSAGNLSKQADSLRGEVETFLRQIKEA
jgi:hypothetical protein